MNDLPTSFTSGVNAARHTDAPRVANGGTREDIEKTAKDFESFFLTQVLEYMFADIPTDGPFGGGFGEDIYRSFMLQEYGKTLANSGGIGLADAVMKEMISIQEMK